MPVTDLFFDFYAHLKEFPDYALLDVARNDSAQWDYRKHAVEVLRARKSPKARHPDLKDLLAELEIELDGIEFETPAPVEDPEPEPAGPGPLSAGFTTKNMFADTPPEDTQS